MHTQTRTKAQREMQRKHATQMCTYRGLGWHHVLEQYAGVQAAGGMPAYQVRRARSEAVSYVYSVGARFSQAKLGIVSRAAPVAGHECYASRVTERVLHPRA